MSIEAFEAIKGSIRSFLGGAEVELGPAATAEGVEEGCIRKTITVEKKPYIFIAKRGSLPFTRAEEAFCGELLVAFAAMYSGFRQEGYNAHFRTALIASMMDIAVARFLRGDRTKVFWPIQQLIQLLKNLSYQKYEGRQATTGFIVHRTTQQNILQLLKDRHHDLWPLKPAQNITSEFFANPLTYRYVDGSNLFFIVNIQMQVNGVVRVDNQSLASDIERFTQKEIFSIVNRAGEGAFAVTVNESGEIEILTTPAKIMVRRKGGWGIFDKEIFKEFLAESMEPASQDDLIWTAYALSKSRHGTVILIHNGGKKQLTQLKKGSVGGDDPIVHLLINGVTGRTITQLKQAGSLLRILSTDGMTVFNSKGKLLETGFIIDTSHAREMVAGGGRTTAAYAASFFGKVIKVSQDGPIELYNQGKLVYRFG